MYTSIVKNVYKNVKKLVQNVFFEKCLSPKSNRCVHQKKKIMPLAFFCPICHLFFPIKSVIFQKITRFMARPVLREKKRNLRILSDVYIKKKSSRCVHQFVIFSFSRFLPSPKRIMGSPKRI